MELEDIFKNLDDKKDIFKYLLNFITTDNENCLIYKVMCEYGMTIIIADIDGTEFDKLFINMYKDEKFSSKDFYISSSTYFGLTEKIFSNRTEYYICNNYYSNELNENLIMYIKLINKHYLEDNGEEMYDFIKSNKQIDFLPYNIVFSNIEEKLLICEKCKSQIIPVENICDFCNKKLCETCLSNSYYHFVECYTCSQRWCYYDGIYKDYKCEKAPRNGSCLDCGN
jgi:hypothetical protein